MMVRFLLCLLVLSALSLADARGRGRGGKGRGGRGKRECTITAPCLRELTDFKAEFKTSFNFPVDFEAHGHLALDQRREFLDFEFTVDKGINEMEELIKKAKADGPMGNDLNSFDNALNGNERFSLKARISHHDLSVALKIAQAGPLPFFPPESDTLCVREDLMKLQQDIGDAMQAMPPGAGVNGMAPHPHAEMDRYRSEMPKNVTSWVREGMAEWKDLLEKADADSDCPQIHGHTTYVLHLDKLRHDAEEQFPQASLPSVFAQMDMPPLFLFADKDNRLSKIMVDFTDSPLFRGPNQNNINDAEKVFWFNITSLKLGDFDVEREPVCDEGVGLQDLMQQGMPPQRRLGEGPMKLAALEALSTVFRVTKVLAPKSSSFVPSDATQLWNAKDRDAAIIERTLANRLKEAENKAPMQPTGNMFLAGIALLVVASFAVGVAMGRRRPSEKRSSDLEMLVGSAE